MCIQEQTATILTEKDAIQEECKRAKIGFFGFFNKLVLHFKMLYIFCGRLQCYRQCSQVFRVHKMGKFDLIKPKIYSTFRTRCSFFSNAPASCFRNLDKLNKNDNEMNNGEVKRTQKHITCPGLYDAKQARRSAVAAREAHSKKKHPAKINENAYQDNRMATHEIMHFVRKMRGIFFSASTKNLFYFLCADLRTSAMAVLFLWIFESHKYDNSKKFYHANEMFNRVPFLQSFRFQHIFPIF